MKAIIASLVTAVFFSTYIQAIPLFSDPTTATISSQPNLTGTNGGFCAPPSEHYQWVRSGWLREDCYAAFNLMRSSVLSVKDVVHTFVDVRSKSFPPKPNEVMTPKRYPVNTCTMALILISTFERKEGRSYLPGAQGFPFVAKDTSTYAEIIQDVVRLEDHCLDRQGIPGWTQLGAPSKPHLPADTSKIGIPRCTGSDWLTCSYPVGESNGLGAFFWATGSALDMDFPQWASDIEGANLLNETDAVPIYEAKPQLTG